MDDLGTKLERNEDLPENVRKCLPSENGQTLFRSLFNVQSHFGSSALVAFAASWEAIKDFGFEEDENGIWESYHPVFKSNGALPVYGCRPVMNSEEIIEWAKSQGFTSVLPADDMHVTVLFSKRAFSANLTAQSMDEWYYADHWDNVTVEGDERSIMQLGDQGAVVLKVQSEELTREWNYYKQLGASWGYPEYQPHITLTYKGAPPDLSKVQPYTGAIVLGTTKFAPINLENPFDPDTIEEVVLKKTLKQPAWFDRMASFFAPVAKSGPEATIKVLKVDDDKRIVWGWASVTTLNGQPIVDSHGDMIDTNDLIEAADDFMFYKRTGKVMHDGKDTAIILHSFPYSHDLGKALGFTCDREGWVIAQKIIDDDHWAKVKSGELPAFSIGGKGLRVEA